MSEVQRYGMKWHEVTERSVFMADEDGDYVKLSDYAALQHQVSQLAAENYAQKEVINAVVAVANQSNGISGWHLNGEVAGWGEILPEIYDEITPHTDAFLLNSQADGVDKVAETLITQGVCTSSHTVNYFKEFAANLRAQATALQQKDEGHA